MIVQQQNSSVRFQHNANTAKGTTEELCIECACPSACPSIHPFAHRAIFPSNLPSDRLPACLPSRLTVPQERAELRRREQCESAEAASRVEASRDVGDLLAEVGR